METTELKPLRIHLQEFLESVGADYQCDEENHFYAFGMTSNGMNIKAFILYNEENDWMRCHIPMPIKVPEEKRTAAILLLNKMNNGTPGICLSMDEEDGEIISTMVVNTDNGAINYPILNAMIHTCFNAIDACIPQIIRIIYQQPEDILLQVSSKQINNSVAN